jgi:hypothetical protein
MNNNTFIEFSPRDKHFQSFHELATRMNGCTSLAIIQYRPIADGIINGMITDRHEVDLILDYMLDFCFNDEMLAMYKQVCRAIINDYPDIVADHIDMYRKMWDNDEGEGHGNAYGG